MTTTNQFFDSRIFKGPNASEAGKAFASLAGEQVGLTFEASKAVEGVVSVDLTAWPEEVMFGSWFVPLMAKHNVVIWD